MSPSNFLLNKNILIGVTGSISAYKICEVISSLKKMNCDIKVIATPSALQFIGKATFEGLTGHSVLTSDFTDGSMMSHIQLAKWADVFVVAPATAQTLNSLAQGTGSGILISTYLAYDLKKPLLIAPAMNTRMLEHPTTQSSIKKLISMGATVLNTGSGDLACGDIGAGRLVEPQELVSTIETSLSPSKNISILITAGGTKVPIDSVRSITNTSTGATGSRLADYFSEQKYSVDLLLSNDGVTPQKPINIQRFETYDDLSKLLKNTLKQKQYDLIIHAAAVSDFTVSKKTNGKLTSGAQQTLTLEPTEKLLKQLKVLNPKSCVVGFKLTDTQSNLERATAIQKIFSQNADIVVHNDLSNIQNTSHVFTVYNDAINNYDSVSTIEGATSLAKTIEQLFIKRVENKANPLPKKTKNPLKMKETFQ